MGRPKQNSHVPKEAEIAFFDELLSLVRTDGHTLSLSARKKLIDAIERFQTSVTVSDRIPSLLTENGQHH